MSCNSNSRNNSVMMELKQLNSTLPQVKSCGVRNDNNGPYHLINYSSQNKNQKITIASTPYMHQDTTWDLQRKYQL